MNMVSDDYNDQMIPGDEFGSNFLTIALELRKNPGKNLNQETYSTGDRTQSRRMRGKNIVPKPQRCLAIFRRNRVAVYRIAL